VGSFKGISEKGRRHHIIREGREKGGKSGIDWYQKRRIRAVDVGPKEKAWLLWGRGKKKGTWSSTR